MAKPSKLEATLWREAWRTPQATAWEELGWVRPVARYVTFSAQLSDTTTDTSATAMKTMATEVRLLEDRLGLSPMAMRHLGWEIAGTSGVVSIDRPAESGRDGVLRVIRGTDGAA